MAKIVLLDEITIDKIAAGEVVERPLNVVKELCENAFDSGADSITVEIQNGGKKLIRVTDNGCGIEKTDIRNAFLRHATSKISDVEDLLKLTSLGFRGEALSSIASVASVEMLSKVSNDLMGIHYIIEGSKEIEYKEAGIPDGTTVIVKDLFYNVPVRREFLNSDQSEAGKVSDLMEHLALSHPDISIKYISNKKTVFSTSGNGNLLEVIYRLYGKDIKNAMIPYSYENDDFKAYGFIGKPEICRSSRSFECYFINGRYIHCQDINNAIEEGYRNFLMQHKFPFIIIHFEFDPKTLDVNIHPQKMEVKLSNIDSVYKEISYSIYDTLSKCILIPEAGFENKNAKDQISISIPEPFETNRKQLTSKDLQPKLDVDVLFNENENNALGRNTLKSDRLNIDSSNNDRFSIETIDIESTITDDLNIENSNVERLNIETKNEINKSDNTVYESKISTTSLDDNNLIYKSKTEQISIFDNSTNEEYSEPYTVLGQLFKTYWLIAFKDKLYIMDQHAAHEKVKYEAFLKKLKNKEVYSQQINPPVIINLSAKEENVINQNIEYFKSMGFEIEDFGMGSIAVRAFPTDLYGCNEQEFFKELIDELIDNPLKGQPDVILDKLASMSCKAAIKGNTFMNNLQIEALLNELLKLDNPFNCPHGRPTIISMSKYEIDKKFKRIVD